MTHTTHWTLHGIARLVPPRCRACVSHVWEEDTLLDIHTTYFYLYSLVVITTLLIIIIMIINVICHTRTCVPVTVKEDAVVVAKSNHHLRLATRRINTMQQ